MALSDLDVRAQYNGDGSTTTFAIPAAEVDGFETETKVYIDDTLQTLTTDYTISSTNVVFNSAPASGTKNITIIRQLSLTQPTDLAPTGAVDLDAIESALDRLAALIQQVEEKTDRAALLKLTSSFTGITLPEPSADAVLTWNTGATDLENKTAAEVLSLTGALVASNNLSDLADAAAALGNLGLTATAAELNYMDGVTSNVQTQLDGKEPTVSLTASRALQSSAGGALEASAVTDTELGYLSGVTSAVQTQLDAKIPTSSAPSGDIVGTTDTQDISGKTFTDAITLEEQGSTPSNPSSGDKKFYAKNDGKIYTLNSSGVETEVGAGSGGGGSDTNWFADRDATDTGAVSEYDDTNSEPTDGTGVDTDTDEISVALETTNPLYGTSSYKLSKTAANGQGQGWAFAMSDIDDGAYGRTLTVQFRYKTSANYADGDVTVWVYRTGSNTLEALNGFDGLGNYSNELKADTSTGGATYTSSFSLSSSDTGARVLLHVASTSTSAYDITLDHIFIGEKAVLQAPIVTDAPTPYTPTYSAGMGTVTHDYANYRRVGDLMHIEGRFTTGTVTTGTANISLPSGYTVNVDGNRGAGRWDANVGSTADFSSGAFQLLDGDTVIYMGDSFSTAASSGTVLSSGNANVILSSSTAYTWEIVVPITEWSGNSTNILNSTQQDFQTPASFATGQTPTGTIGTAFNKATFGTLERNDLTAYNTSSGQWTALRDGKVFAGARFEFGFSLTLGGEHLAARIANTTSGVNITNSIRVGSGLTAEYVNVHGMLEVSKGDVIEVQSWANTTSTTFGSSFGSSNFYIAYQPDYSIIGNAGVPDEEYTSTSSTLTPTGSGQFHQMTGNSLSLPPGKWEISGVVGFRGSGTPSYTYMQADWYEANGANSGSAPTAIGTNFTSLGLASTEYELGFDSATVDSHRVSMPTITVRNTSTASIYLVPYTAQTDTADARITVYLHARRLK